MIGTKQSKYLFKTLCDLGYSVQTCQIIPNPFKLKYNYSQLYIRAVCNYCSFIKIHSNVLIKYTHQIIFFRMFKVLFSLLIVRVCSSLHLGFTDQQFKYSYQVFTLTWPGSFCSQGKQCKKSWTDTWDGRRFTVHGLWPNSNDKGFTDMISTNNQDPKCTAPFKFNLGWFNQDQMKRLTDVMPELTRNNFWEHEWNKHGVCYLKLLNDKVNPSKPKIANSFAKKAYSKYWEDIISFYGQITQKFNLTKGTYDNGDELAKDLGLNLDSVRFNVGRNGDLKEIMICTNLPQNLDANQRVTKCPKPSNFKYSINLPGWKRR